jgi:hypothetical protein
LASYRCPNLAGKSYERFIGKFTAREILKEKLVTRTMKPNAGG